MYFNQNGQFIDQNNDLIKSNEVSILLDKYDLNWEVVKTPLILPSGEDTGFFGTVRQDTRKTFGSFKGSYEVFQNDELARIVLDVADVLGVQSSNGGSFKEGAKVFMQIAMDDKKVGNDTIKRWTTAINSFDGSSALKWGSTGTTISCSNTFASASRDMQSSVKHTVNMREVVERSLRILERVETEENSLFEIFSKMADTKASKETVQHIIKMVSSVDVTKKESVAKKDYSTRAINTAQDLTRSIVNEMSYKEDSLWGLFSGVTHFTTHKSGTEKNREESKMLGSLQRTDNQVLAYLSNLV
jgi:hypothetical protein